MKTFNEIKSEFESKNYSLSDIKKSIIFFSIVRFLFTELFLFAVSTIPFLIGFGIITSFYGFSTAVSIFYLVIHLLFYIFYVKGQHTNNLLPTLNECDMVIKALKEIKQEKVSK
jgi:hypothetical protein